MHVLVVLNLDRLTNRVDNHSLPPVSTEAEGIHFSSFIVDMHSDALMWSRDCLERNSLGHVDLPRLADGGVSLQVFSAGTNFPLGPSLYDRKSEAWPDYYTSHALIHRWPRRTIWSQLQRALYMADRLHDCAERSRGQLAVIRTTEDLEMVVGAKTTENHRVGGLLSLEGAHALEGNLDNLEVLHEAGFRVVGLAHFIDNPFAGSATGMERGGLTPLGLELLNEMERLGVMPDLAHASSRAIRDVLDVSRKPVLVTHTGVRATCDKDRNLSDDELREVAESGGVIGIAFGEILICGDQVADIVAAIRHVTNLVGDEHVALGSDFDGGITAPFDASGLPALTQAMMDAGLEEESVRRILGGNVLRVLRAWLPKPEGFALTVSGCSSCGRRAAEHKATPTASEISIVEGTPL